MFNGLGAFHWGDRNNWNNVSVHSIWWFLISLIGHNLLSYSLFRSSSYIIVPIVPGGVNQLNINHLGPEQSLFHIVPHCSGPNWLIFNGLDVFHWGDRNNGTMVWPTFLGGTVEIFAKTQWNKGFINFFRGLILFKNPYSLPLFTAGPCHGGQYPRLGGHKKPGLP